MPKLASAYGGLGGVAYSVWRPQARTYLMQRGIEERDYAREIKNWSELDKAVQDDAQRAEDDAFALLLDKAAFAEVKAEAEDKAKKAQAQVKQRAADAMSRSRKAFGYLYSALPPDLRPLVADVPQGYAFGIWSFLEKKFRSTEQDNVLALWKRLTSAAQDQDEKFDEFKARLDADVELLANAKQVIPAGLYASLLVWNLQSRYDQAVLTLKTSDKLKEPEKIDWPSVCDYFAQFERSQDALGNRHVLELEHERDRVMAVRGKNRGGRQVRPDLSKIKCFNCQQLGHYASSCQEPDRRDSERRGDSGQDEVEDDKNQQDEDDDPEMRRHKGRRGAAMSMRCY